MFRSVRVLLVYVIGNAFLGTADGTIEIADVEASRIEGEKKVLIIYDLGNTDGVPTEGTLEVTSNGEYWIESNFATGDIGDSVAQGFNKRIIWDVGSEWPDGLYPFVKARVRIDDGQVEEVPVVPAGFSYIPKSSFGMGSTEAEKSIVSTASESIDPSDEIRHQSIISQGFFIGQTEVSFTEWTEVRN